ncbi:MAG TPA: glutamate--tRNA ligase [Syntrophorhabdaceae bacterium]|nr:glutamate--tRNA ligase [Syntrophorhabdaceae bacterium]
MQVKVRFAPSPTGHLHVGNAKIALVNYLFARKENGRLILRIEDTDLERSDVSYEQSIIEDLKWLGIIWDEGPIRQTDRFSIYQTHAEDLLRKGAAYKCFCSPETLEQMREASLKKGEPPRYDGRCRRLPEPEIANLEASGVPHVIRFKSTNKPVKFRDAIHGEVSFPFNHVDDFILMKNSGTPSYNFAAVIDDLLMGITHVMRGADHLSNTPKQIMLFEILGAEPPLYGHLSLLVGEDSKPLSKRHGVTRIQDFRDIGILPEALRNYLCTIGRSVTKEVMNMAELISTFSLNSLSRTNSFFDLEKLYWFNKEYMRGLPLDQLLSYLELSSDHRDQIAVLRENAISLNEMKEYLAIFESQTIHDQARSYLSSCSIPDGLLTGVADMYAGDKRPSVEDVVRHVTETYHLKKKDTFMLLRIFITGRTNGPPLSEIAELVPSRIITGRLQTIIESKNNSDSNRSETSKQ